VRALPAAQIRKAADISTSRLLIAFYYSFILF
jgi:hypothetical protein